MQKITGNELLFNGGICKEIDKEASTDRREVGSSAPSADTGITMKEYAFKQCVHEIFMQKARACPENIALVAGQQRISYGKLDALSSTLARYLMQIGVNRGGHVCIFTERSISTIVAILASLKAGGVYVPLDITLPAERISFILNDCNPVAVMTTRSVADRLPQDLKYPLVFVEEASSVFNSSEAIELQAVCPEDAAYIIYTSGTTGRPKGVIIPHRGIVRLVFDQHYIEFGPEKKFLQLASPAFDAATFEIWGPLLHGAVCVLYPGDSIPDPRLLQQLIQENRITTLWLTATLFNTLISVAPDCLHGVLEILTGGEALSPVHVRKALRLLPGTKLINGYGPTENTTFTTCYQIPSKLLDNCVSIPIGIPLKHTTVQVCDTSGRRVPDGETGELYIGGAGLALGYLNRPELTREKFVTDQNRHSGQGLLYRTGDLVRVLPDGNLDYVGRIDDQVKIRGFRVEPGEVTSCLVRHPEIQDAVVVVHVEEVLGAQLIAYIIYKNIPVSDDRLTGYLSEYLPDYMVPSCFMPIESMPFTTNGKLDRKKLPLPVRRDRHNYIEAGTVLEKQLVALWKDLLHLELVSVEDNFFDIGGTSLLGIELIASINSTMNPKRQLNPVDLYQFPTIKVLAEYLDRTENTNDTSKDVKNRACQQKTAFGKFKKIRRSA